mgnify:CR=1 FL=1
MSTPTSSRISTRSRILSSRTRPSSMSRPRSSPVSCRSRIYLASSCFFAFTNIHCILYLYMKRCPLSYVPGNIKPEMYMSRPRSSPVSFYSSIFFTSNCFSVKKKSQQSFVYGWIRIFSSSDRPFCFSVSRSRSNIKNTIIFFFSLVFFVCTSVFQFFSAHFHLNHSTC